MRVFVESDPRNCAISALTGKTICVPVNRVSLGSVSHARVSLTSKTKTSSRRGVVGKVALNNDWSGICMHHECFRSSHRFEIGEVCVISMLRLRGASLM